MTLQIVASALIALGLAMACAMFAHAEYKAGAPARAKRKAARAQAYAMAMQRRADTLAHAQRMADRDRVERDTRAFNRAVMAGR